MPASKTALPSANADGPFCDVAYVLEALPPEDRLLVWSQVAAEQAGDVFVEASDGVRKFLIAETDERKSVADALDELRARGELPSC